MQKHLKTKLEKLSRDQLLALLEELGGDMISDLRFSMRQHPDMFTNEEKLRYAEFYEE